MTLRGPLYPRIHAFDNLLLAAHKAARGKRGRAAAAAFEQRMPDALIELRDELASCAYRPGQYTSFYVHEPKKRLISAAPFRDRVVHHALCNVIEPIFERSFIDDSYANRKGKGTHKAIVRCQSFGRRFRYVLPCDIRQHFPSIDHDILMGALSRRIADERVRGLCQTILDSGTGVLDEHYDMVFFPGDDLFAMQRPRGLPIGNLTSQFWSNCFLDPFDHFVKRRLRCRGYLRYVDDFLLFSNDKFELLAWKRAIVEKLASLRLCLHERRAQPRPVSTGIPWLGFVVYPDQRRLKRRNVDNARRRLRAKRADVKRGALPLDRLDASWQGWAAHAAYTRSPRLVEEMRKRTGYERMPRS